MSGDTSQNGRQQTVTTLAATALSMDEKPGKESRQDHKTVVDTFPKSYRVLSLARLCLCCPEPHAAAFCSLSHLALVAGACCFTIRDITCTYTAENHFLNAHFQMFNINVLWDMTPCNMIDRYKLSKKSTPYMFIVDFYGISRHCTYMYPCNDFESVT